MYSAHTPYSVPRIGTSCLAVGFSLGLVHPSLNILTGFTVIRCK